MEASTQARTPPLLPYSQRGCSTGFLLCEAAATATKEAELDTKKSAAIRQRTHMKIWCSPDDKAKIEELARGVGESASSYLRLVGLGYKPRNVVDLDEVQRLIAVNGDLGRLGGLLKLWLSDDPKLDEFKPDEMRRIVRGVLKKIEAGQEELRDIAKSVLIARP